MTTTPLRWHPGEEAMHRRLRVPYEDNPTIPGLPMAYGMWLAESPLLALGAVDRDGDIWTTILGGAAGVTVPGAAGALRLSTTAHRHGRTGWKGLDPVLDALFADGGTGPEQRVSGLAIDLEQRTRVKLAGRMLSGVAQETADAGRVDIRMTLAVDETLGNCPKYLNRKVVRPHDASPQLIADTLPLPPEAVDLIGRADIFFLSSRHGAESMDTNNRGGAPGFVRVFSNSDDEGVTLVYPEYSGNRLYQTLGNLITDHAVGMTFPDFETGDVLFLTGQAEILVGAEAAAVLPHSKLAVRVKVRKVRWVRDGLPFRGRFLDPSPYNPPVRKLARELDGEDPAATPLSLGTATLVDRRPVTPTITRYTFGLDPEMPPWRAGQHVTLDFSAQLDRGWSHMRDHDPRSLNDDYVRSFTISSPPSGREFEITVRRQGPVTGLLARWTPAATVRATVLGFGGGDEVSYIDDPGAVADVVVVAAGVGITPLLAQARQALKAGPGLTVLWGLRADDVPLAADAFDAIDGLAERTTLFVTGQADVLLGARVQHRRMTRADVLGVGVAGRRRFHVCAGRDLRNAVMEWAAGEEVRSESFDY